VRISYDARGLAEPVAQAPRVATVESGENGLVAVFDAAELTTRQINLELRRLVYDEGVAEVTIRNPGAKHSLAVGILARCRITIEGSLGYFGCGLIDGPEIHITGRVGWSVAENMMSGVVVIDKNSGSLTGAALRGGDVVVRGDVGARSADDEFLARKLGIYGIEAPASWRKFVCGRKLWNYDNLEPAERKLVL
jgi:glutamate synthase domain-containing protein 3